MKLRIASVVAVLAVVGLAPAVRSQVPAPDWVLYKLTAGPAGVQGLRWGAGASLAFSGPDAAVMGAGVGIPSAGFAFVPVFSMGGGPLKVSTTSGLGSVDVTVTPKGNGTGGIGTGAFVGNLAPGQSAGQLFFGSGGTLSNYDLVHEFDSGSVDVAVTVGTGTRPLLSVDPNDAGTAVQVATAAAGTSSHAATTAAGVAGGFTGFECGDFCRSTWSSPDGRSGSIDFVAVHAELIGTGSWTGPLRFAGPAGEWDWSWTGVKRARVFETLGAVVPAYGAYAPIGNDWPLFAGR